MMPFFVTYLIQFLLQIAGLIAVLFIVFGGFKYVTGGLIEDKESGKKLLFTRLSAYSWLYPRGLSSILFKWL